MRTLVLALAVLAVVAAVPATADAHYLKCDVRGDPVGCVPCFVDQVLHIGEGLSTGYVTGGCAYL